MSGATEATTDAELQIWHDEAYAEYEAALEAYTADQSEANEADYNEARDNLVAGVQYWRQVGEQVGTRSGVQVVDNTLDEGDEL